MYRQIPIPSEEEQAGVVALLEDEQGRLRPVAADDIRRIKPTVLSWYALTRGVYGLATFELLDRLRGLLPENTIEVGAGNGVFGRALGLRMTDSHVQETDKYLEVYRAAKQPRVRYGADVERKDGLTAVRDYKPDAVFGSWVTHKYRPERHELGGNEDGIDELALCRKVETFVLYGNDLVHDSTRWFLEDARRAKKLKFDFQRIYDPTTFFSRAEFHSLNCLMIWRLRR